MLNFSSSSTVGNCLEDNITSLFVRHLSLHTTRLSVVYIKTSYTKESLWFKEGVQQDGCSKKQENRKLGIEKIGKIGNFVLKNRRKIGKSIVLSSTQIAPLYPIRVLIKATSPQPLYSQDLDQLSRLKRCEKDQ